MALVVDALDWLVVRSCTMSTITQRRVARALRPGGPEVIEVVVEDLAPLKTGEVFVLPNA